MWLFKEAALNCVRMKIFLRPELMQFEMGISIMRYFAASGTAGFERSFTSGKSRVPRPPPRMMVQALSFNPSTTIKDMPPEGAIVRV